MFLRRLLEVVAMMIIGDSVLGMLSPRRHMLLWLDGPSWWQRMNAPFLRHPDMTRALSAAGLAFGLWLAWKQEPDAPEEEYESVPRRWVRRLEEAAR